MAYKILPYTFAQAKKIGVEVKPSRVKGKKIDVFKNGKKVASVGALGYGDFPTYMQLEKQGKVPRGYSLMKRKSYKARHVFRNIKETPAYYADQLLW